MSGVMRRWAMAVCLLLVPLVAFSSGKGEGNASTGKDAGGSAVQVRLSKDNPFQQPGSAKLNWRQSSGDTLHIMMNEHWYTDAIKGSIIEDFQAMSGIKVTMDVLSEEAYFKKLRLVMSAGNSDPDVFMVGNLDIAQFAKAGWLEPVNAYLNNEKLTDKAWYDYDDVISTIKGAGTFGDKTYIIAIPTAEAEIMYYRKDLLKAKNLKVPETYEELYETAKALNTKDVAGFQTRGARGLNNWWEWTGFFLSYGGTFFGPDGKPAFNSPEGAAATEMWGKLMRDAGPDGVANFAWMENCGNFKNGGSAIMIEASGSNPLLVSQKDSKVWDKIGYAQIPHLPGKAPRPNYWTWAIGMNSKSKTKAASWLLLEYLSSKAISYETTIAGGAGACRTSVLKSPAFAKTFGQEFTDVVQKALTEYVDPKLIPYDKTEINEIADEISVGLSNVLTQTETAPDALDKAAKRVQDILKN